MLIDTGMQKEFDQLIAETRDNYLFYVSRKIGRALLPPDTIQIMLTSRCNLRCRMCGVWKNQYKTEDELSTAQVKDLIDQAIEMGVKTVYFTGGEALLREDIFELIDYAARDGVITTFNTNGSLISEEVAQRIVNSKLRSIAFSIDSPNEEVHDALRGKGVFRSALQAIEWINLYKKNTGRPDLVMCSVVMRKNIQDLDGLVHLAQKNGFCYLAFQPFVDNSGLWQQAEDGYNEFWVDKDSLNVLNETLVRVDDFKRDNPRPVIDVMKDKLISYFKKEWRVNTCFAGFNRIFVNPLGDISFVCFESFGNIKRDKLKDVWYGAAANELRKRVKDCKLNCTQFCSEKPDSEDPLAIHKDFFQKIQDKFHGEFCAELLEKEKALLAEFVSLGADMPELRKEIDDSLGLMPRRFTDKDLFIAEKASAVADDPRQFTQFYLAITNRCNLKCIMCSTTRHPHEQEHELSREEWMTLLANITRFKTQVITFGGGEPLLRQNDLVGMINFVADRGITVNVVTNGTLMNEAFLNSISHHKDKVTFLVSCDGLKRENDLIRGEGTFDKIIRAANLIKEYGFKLFFTSVIMPENFFGFIDFLKFLNSSYPGNELDIQPVIPHNEVYHRRKSFELSDEQIKQLKAVLEFLHTGNKLRLCRSLQLIDRYLDYFLGTLTTKNQCKMGTESFNVNLRGNIWICGKELEYPLHRYKLESVLQSDGYQKEMRRVKACQSPCLAGLVI